MIKKLLNEISREIFISEAKHNHIKNYALMRDHVGWKTHQMFLVMIANRMSEYILKPEFLQTEDKDVIANIRAFSMTKEIIDFLFDPLKGARNLAKIQRHNEKLEATGKKQP